MTIGERLENVKELQNFPQQIILLYLTENFPWHFSNNNIS